MTIHITEKALNALCGAGTSTRSDFGITAQVSAIPEDIAKAVYGLAFEVMPELNKAYLRCAEVSRTVNGTALMIDMYYAPFDGAETVCIETADEYNETARSYYEF